MSAIISAFDAINRAAMAANPPKPGDYTGQDGLLYCGICHKQKQCRITLLDEEKVVYCICDCTRKQEADAKANADRSNAEKRRKECFGETIYKGARLIEDDHKNPELSRICSRYAERFSEKAKWLLLYGETGTGKSWSAAMIANALIDSGLVCRFVTISDVERQLWGAKSKSDVYEEFWACDLLVIDDFGAERDTEYMQEVKFALIDGRLRSAKPCIITTNLSLREFASPKSVSEKRIASRIFEAAIPYEVKGEDRRFCAFRQSAKSLLSQLID